MKTETIKGFLVMSDVLDEISDRARWYLETLELLNEEDIIRTYVQEVEEYGMSPEGMNDSDNRPVNSRYLRNKDKLERIVKFKSDIESGKFKTEIGNDYLIFLGEKIPLKKPFEELQPEVQQIIRLYQNSPSAEEVTKPTQEVIATVRKGTEASIELSNVEEVEKFEGIEIPQKVTTLKTTLKAKQNGKLVFIPEEE